MRYRRRSGPGLSGASRHASMVFFGQARIPVRGKGVPVHRLEDSAIMGYHWEVVMTDMLIRDVPDEVIAAVDAHAGRLGLSRSEYVRRRLAQDAASGSPVSVGDLTRFADAFGDLADPEVMSRAWR